MVSFVSATLRKPQHRGSQRLRDVLLHLEMAGFDAAPRSLGIDEQRRRRNVLCWIDGETFTDRGWMHPYIGDPPDRSRPTPRAGADGCAGKGG